MLTLVQVTYFYNSGSQSQILEKNVIKMRNETKVKKDNSKLNQLINNRLYRFYNKLPQINTETVIQSDEKNE